VIERYVLPMIALYLQLSAPPFGDDPVEPPEVAALLEETQQRALNLDMDAAFAAARKLLTERERIFGDRHKKRLRRCAYSQSLASRPKPIFQLSTRRSPVYGLSRTRSTGSTVCRSLNSSLKRPTGVSRQSLPA
jgi:hypothetical protein